MPGEPTSKARPRFARTQKGVRTYTPTRTLKYEELVRYYALTER
ncbi:MAG: RusA family crossover junction endodeoxyribonuclease, partial [Lactobacillus sp.]|nr:RusA family crossover junction endodeoxyribonuclease [Lactobacillus sp.]